MISVYRASCTLMRPSSRSSQTINPSAGTAAAITASIGRFPIDSSPFGSFGVYLEVVAQHPKLPPRWLRLLDVYLGGLVFPVIAIALIALLLLSIWL